MKWNDNAWNQRVKLLWLVLLTALILAGCGGPPPLHGNGGKLPAAGAGGAGQGQGGRRNINVRGLEDIPPGDRSLFTNPNNPLSTRIIYFAYDRSTIPARFSKAIQAHAHYLAQHSQVHLRLEGNTDERGTREYNIALGERRAEAVKQALVLSGANANQISTISFGEERPAVLGHNKAAYAKNRRVVLNYTQ
jgi:peptidoglycan-associated lipoprotein